MSNIFESKPRIFRRKVRDGFSKFFGAIGGGARKAQEGFRALPYMSRMIIRVGSVVLVLAVVFVVFWLPILQRTEPEPEPPSETVAELMQALETNAVRELTAAQATELAEYIDNDLMPGANEEERAHLLSMRAMGFARARMQRERAESLEMSLAYVPNDCSNLVRGQRLNVYERIASAYRQIGDGANEKRFLALQIACTPDDDAQGIELSQIRMEELVRAGY